MIPEYIPKTLFEKTTSDFKNKFEKRLENLDKKIDAQFDKIEIINAKINIQSEKISKEIKHSHAKPLADVIPIWTRFNLAMKEYMQKIKNFTLKIFKKG
jgi:hypothetical protein